MIFNTFFYFLEKKAIKILKYTYFLAGEKFLCHLENRPVPQADTLFEVDSSPDLIVRIISICGRF